MSSKNRKGRQSLPPANSSQAAAAAYPFPPPGYPAFSYPFQWTTAPVPAPGSAGSVSAPNEASAPKKLPWEESSSSSDEDFVRPKKVKREAKEESGKKRGPGRPRKSEASEAVLAKYPPAIKTKDTVAYRKEDECPKCRVFTGRIIIKPCGHSKYCNDCVNSIRTEALTLKRPSKCPEDGCFSLIEGWVQLFNVSG